MRGPLRLLLVPAVLCLSSLAHAVMDPAIAFLKGNRLCVMNSNGTNQTMLTSFNVGRPAYSPDGQWLAFEAGTGAPQGWGVYVIRVNGTGLRRVVAKNSDSVFYDVDWALTPDGVERIAYTNRVPAGAHSSLYATDLAGLDVVQLTFNTSESIPTFSRGGDRIYTSNETDALAELQLGVVNGRLAVIQSRGLVTAIPGSPLTDWSILSVNVAKTSDRIVIDAMDFLGSFQSDIWVIDPADPISAVNLTTNHAEMCTDPTWSPDDSQIAFSTKLGNRVTIARMPSTGGAITNLSNNTTKNAHTKPSWRRQP